MDKKLIYNKKLTMRDEDRDLEEVSTYKNQNIVFKIHSGKNEQNYNAKNFPAKFSINICNQPTQLASGQYNRNHIQSLATNSDFNSPRKHDNENARIEKQPKFDFQQYQRQLRTILEDKKKCDDLIQQLEQTCQEYEKQNINLSDALNQKDRKIQQLQKIIQRKQKIQNQLNQVLNRKQIELRQAIHRIKMLQHELKKLKQSQSSKYKQNSQLVLSLQNRIAELQAVISQKQQTIKNLSNFNDEISRKILDEQSYNSNAHLKQMQKWLKMLNKKYYNPQKQQQQIKKSTIQLSQQALISQLLQKQQMLLEKVSQLQKTIQKLQQNLTQTTHENKSLLKINEQLNKIIGQLQQNYQSQMQSLQSQQKCPSFPCPCPKSPQSRSPCSHSISHQPIYQGTVKIKMQYLLLEKDKRISTLENQLQDCKKQNTLLRTKMYQLDCEQDFCNQVIRNTQQFANNRTRSLGSFYKEKSENNFRIGSFEGQRDKNEDQIARIMYQCNNLTQTLGNFMQTCKTQRASYQQQERKERYSQCQPSKKQPQLKKIKQMLNIQKQTFQLLQKKFQNTNAPFSPNPAQSPTQNGHNLQQIRWNNYRKQAIPNQRQNQNYDKQNPRNVYMHRYTPSTDRNYAFKRSQKGFNSYYFNENY